MACSFREARAFFDDEFILLFLVVGFGVFEIGTTFTTSEDFEVYPVLTGVGSWDRVAVSPPFSILVEVGGAVESYVCVTWSMLN